MVASHELENRAPDDLPPSELTLIYQHLAEVVIVSHGSH